jgi:thiol-disulfide isomerase/thioredoxin
MSKACIASLVVFVVVVAITLYLACTPRGGQEAFGEPSAVFTFWKMEGCPHCVRFEETYSALKAEFEALGVRFRAVSDLSEARSKGVTAFPTLELAVAGRAPERYSGPRTQKAISEFIKERVR